MPRWLPCLLGVASSVGAALSLHVHLEGKRDVAAIYRQELLNYKDLQFYANVTVGGQSMYAVLDTGSIEFVVLSDKCQYWCGTKKPLYHSKKSKSYLNGKTSLVLSYGSGQLMATEAYEAVTVGPISVPDAPFWEVNDASMPLLFDSDFSAIVGLGPIPKRTRILEHGAPDNTDAAALLLKKFRIDRFGVCLGNEPGASGYFTWNDDNHMKPQWHFTEIPIPDTGYWMAALTDVRLGSQIIACEEGCGAVVDSGTSLLAMPEASVSVMEKVLAAIGTGCSDLSLLPDLRFKLGGVHFSLPADAFIGNVEGTVASAVAGHFNRSTQGKPQKSKDGILAGVAAKSQSACEVALMHINMDSSLGKVWILGAPFFRKYYSIFVQGSDGSEDREPSPPALHVATANRECMPMSDNEARQEALLGHHVHRPRRVDASGLSLPPWAQRAKQLGRLEENVPLRGRTALEPSQRAFHHE